MNGWSTAVVAEAGMGQRRLAKTKHIAEAALGRTGLQIVGCPSNLLGALYHVNHVLPVARKQAKYQCNESRMCSMSALLT